MYSLLGMLLTTIVTCMHISKIEECPPSFDIEAKPARIRKSLQTEELQFLNANEIQNSIHKYKIK